MNKLLGKKFYSSFFGEEILINTKGEVICIQGFVIDHLSDDTNPTKIEWLLKDLKAFGGK